MNFNNMNYWVSEDQCAYVWIVELTLLCYFMMTSLVLANNVLGDDVDSQVIWSTMCFREDRRWHSRDLHSSKPPKD